MTPVTEAAGLRVVPGLGLDQRSWRPTLSALGLPETCVLTLPGSGDPTGRDDVSPAALARKLLGRLPASQPVVLAGHSSSCQVVSHVARLRPAAVRALILVGPTTDPRARTWVHLASRWLATAAREDPRQVPALWAQYRKTGLRSMRRVMGEARHDRLDVTVAAAGCPVLVVRGRFDRICPMDWARALTPEVVTLPRGGHMVPLTHGHLTATEIARFLQRQDGNG